MARKFSFTTYDKKHLRNLLSRASQITKLFDEAARQGSRLGEASGFRDQKGEFFFENYPALKEQVEDLFKELHGNLLAVITEGNREEWLLSAAKNDAMVDSLFGHVARYGERAKEWKEPNLKALQKFTERKERGMNLSDRVWRTTHQFKSELEMALELGLGEGKSAAALSRDVRQYLNEPSKLFRRVRNEKGQLRLSKAAQAYHPGQGIYRSSYKNALRLTATENNMAYRTADHERWQQLDFVIGIQIKLSNNHTCNGRPFVDICDTLQGTYPKTFKFVGWHPFCRCIVVPKLADEDEIIARQQALIDGEELNAPYSGEITTLPDNFVGWVEDNAGRIEEAQVEPYFIRDNREAIKKLTEAAVKTPTIGSVNWFDSLVENTKVAFLSDKCPAALSETVIRSTVRDFATANPTLFDGGLDGLIVKRGGGGEMMHNTRYYEMATGKRTASGNTICIRNNAIWVLDPTTGKPYRFNPFHEVSGALRAIARKQPLTYNQEYSLECLWHEIGHASAPGWADMKAITPQLTGAMEVANQYCARHSYDRFIMALGGKAAHTADVIKGGYGYSRRLTNFNALLKAKSISVKTTFTELSTALRTKPYEDIEGAMIAWLEKNGVDKATASDLIKKLGLDSGDYAKLL